ncbi:MAG: Bcr/CflA family drug resistance efflux transporter [Rickettsiales bacterium]|jgi:DHA1 family bicyclomycin/chloramphenicol resistance-like MFS transporter|nr:Bcr/CflA family drug resistance efflux transporter [Rickettsiales bacterium]
MTTHHPIATKEFTLLMALLISIVAISIDALLPALGILGEELGVTHPNQVQLVIGCIFGGMAIGQLLAGPLSDAIGRKPILYAGIAMYLVGSVVCYFSNDFTFLLIGRCIQGLGVAGPYVTAVSVVRDKFSGRDMASVMSLVMMIFILVPAIAPSLGQVVMHIASWRAIFLLYIVYSIVIGLWIMLRLEETLPRARRLPMKWSAFIHGFRVVVGNRTTCIYMLSMGLCFGSFIGYLGASQQIFQDQFGVGEAFSLYFGGLALVLGVASLMNSRFVVRLGMRFICMRAMGAVVVASALFLGLHYVVDTITLPMFLAYAVVFFFSFGLMFGNINAIAMEPMGDIAGMAAAIIGATSSVISLTLATCIGQMYNNTLIPITCGFLVLSSIAWVLMQAELKWHNAELTNK